MMQDRFFRLTFYSPETIQIYRSMKMEWSGCLIWSSMVCLLLFNSGTLDFSFCCLIYSWWRCERHCCRWKCGRCQSHRRNQRHQRHLRSQRSQNSQRHRRDLWGREGVGPLWLWQAWYLLKEYVLRSSRFQMNVDWFHSLILGWFLCSPLGVQMSKRISDIWVPQDVNSCCWDKTAQKTMQDRFFSFTYCSLETIQIHRSMKMEWSGCLIWSSMVCLLLL